MNILRKIFYKKPSILQGFGLSFGLGMTYFSLLVLIPLIALFAFSFKLEWAQFVEIISDSQVIGALKFSLLTALLAALINLILGFIVAWSLARYAFFGKKILEALIDLPFALPTAVAGIAIAFLLSNNGIIGKIFLAVGIDLEGKSFFAVVVALVFVGIPFVIRTLEPVIKDLDKESLEAASSLGANFTQSFYFVILPSLLPSALIGFALAFARGLGEYGSVIFVSNNIPFESEILPLLIVKKLDSFDYLGGSAVGVFMISVAFVILLAINLLGQWRKRV